MTDCAHGIRRDVMHCVTCELEEERDEAREAAKHFFGVMLLFAEAERTDIGALRRRWEAKYEWLKESSDTSPREESG
jgi:hypothetical protein